MMKLNLALVIIILALKFVLISPCIIESVVFVWSTSMGAVQLLCTCGISLYLLFNVLLVRM